MAFSTRKAELSDIDWILELLKKFSDFYSSKYQLFGDDVEYSKSALTKLIDNHVFIVCEDESKGPAGFICGLITNHFFNPKIKVLSEQFWYVDEKYRNSRAGLLLLNEFILYGKYYCNWITFSLLTNSPVKEETLIKRGFVFKEKALLMEV